MEITDSKLENDVLSFDIFRTEGVDVYGLDYSYRFTR
ncbi:MAG: hypothetical protein R2771_09675 [Saprospiraceae bacterium]